MSITLVYILIATILNGLVAFVGAFSLFLNEKALHRVLLILVAFSAGALLSGAFFHLLAESLEVLQVQTSFMILIGAFSSFYLLERFLHWHHCHEEECEVHSFTYMILIGDGVHNFIDGLVIAASFLVSVPFGVITTLLIIGHEIPQELGDFGVLVHGGFGRTKALLFNFASQLTCVLGGIAGFMMGSIESFTAMLLPFAAGGFIYIAASDLIPELHKELSLSKSFMHFIFFAIGVTFMLFIKLALSG
ncbi:MAG: ZIP family metal transporter [Candidatus Aenigmarchaeota archaeon]|nr:ZIP family metal transporter [Candidatus Aenigmarchaeota archaeon]